MCRQTLTQEHNIVLQSVNRSSGTYNKFNITVPSNTPFNIASLESVCITAPTGGWGTALGICINIDGFGQDVDFYGANGVNATFFIPLTSSTGNAFWAKNANYDQIAKLSSPQTKFNLNISLTDDLGNALPITSNWVAVIKTGIIKD